MYKKIERITRPSLIEEFLKKSKSEPFDLEIQPFKNSCWDRNSTHNNFYDAQNFPIEKDFEQAIKLQKPIIVIRDEDDDDGNETFFFKRYDANDEVDENDSIWLTLSHIKAISILREMESTSKNNLSKQKSSTMRKIITDPDLIREFLDKLSSPSIPIFFDLEIKSFHYSCWNKNRYCSNCRDSENFPIEDDFRQAIQQQTPITVFFSEKEDNSYLFKKHDSNDLNNSIWLTIDYIKSITIVGETKTPIDTTNFSFSRFSNIKQIAIDGAKLAIGKKASLILQNHILKQLRILKVPDKVLEHKITKIAILIGTPNLLKFVLELVPGDKISKKVFTILDSACVSSVAQVSEEIIDLTEGFLKPILKELTAINTTVLEKENKKLLAKNKD